MPQAADGDQHAPPARRRSRWRTALQAAALVALALAALAETAYLLRARLFDAFARGPIERLLSQTLDGAASLGTLSGDWLTGLRISGLRLESAGPLRAVDNGSIDLRFDPWLLLRGDLAGLRAARIHADRIVVDLDAGEAAAAEPAATEGTPLDLDLLLRALPAGAEVTADRCTLRGNGTEITSRATVGLQAAPVAARGRAVQRRVRVSGMGIDADLALASDGAALLQAAAADLGMLASVLPVRGELRGGSMQLQASASLTPRFAASAELRVEGLMAAGRSVRQLQVQGRFDPTGISNLGCTLSAPGASLSLNGAALDFAAPARSLRGDLDVSALDLEPYADLLPDVVRDALPISGRIRARAGDGRLVISQGFAAGAGLELRLQQGALRIDGEPSLDAPLQAELLVRDGARLPLPAAAPVRPTDGAVRLRLAQRNEAFQAAVELDLGIADAEQRAGRLQGDLTATLDAADQAWSVAPQLTVSGSVLRGAAQAATLTGTLRKAEAAVRLEDLAVGVDGRPLVVRADGAVALLPTLAGIAAASSLQVVVDGLSLAGPAKAFMAQDLDGTLSCRLGLLDAALDVALDGEVRGLWASPADDPLRASAALRIDAAGTRISRCELRAATAVASAQGLVAGADLDALLQPSPRWTDWQLDFATALDCSDLSALRLPGSAAALAGELHAQAKALGAAAQPQLQATLAGDGLAFATDGKQVVEQLTLRAALDDDRLRIESLAGTAWSQHVELQAALRREGEAVRIESLEAAARSGGALELDGLIDMATVSDLRAGLARSRLHARLAGANLGPWLPPGALPAESLLADLELTLEPAAASPLLLSLAAKAKGIAADGALPDAELSLRVDGDRSQIALQELRVVGDGVAIEGSGTLGVAALDALLQPDRALSAPLSLQAETQGLELARLPKSLVGLAELTGVVGATARLGGTISQPEPELSLTLQDGTLVTQGGQRLEDLGAELEVGPTALQVRSLRCTRGRGPVELAGAVTAPGPWAQHWRAATADLRLRGTDVLLHRRAGIKVRSDLDVRVQGPVRDLRIEGLVELHDCVVLSRVPLLDWQTTSGRAANEGIVIPGLDLGPDIGGQLDVRVATREPFVIRNNVLDAALDVALSVRGPLSQPTLEGTVSGPDARVLIPGVRLRANTLLVEFQRDAPRFPFLTVSAEGRRHGIDVTAVVRGPYNRPQVLLSSSPPLPPEELIVLITTGARPESLRGSSGVGAVLGAYLAQEFADWIFGSESTEAKEGFLDRFTIDTGAELSRSGTQSIVVEFRLLDSIYLQGERDVYEDLNMGVVYRLRFR